MAPIEPEDKFLTMCWTCDYDKHEALIYFIVFEAHVAIMGRLEG